MAKRVTHRVDNNLGWGGEKLTRQRGLSGIEMQHQKKLEEHDPSGVSSPGKGERFNDSAIRRYFFYV